MSTKHFLAAIVAACVLVPAVTSAQIVLTDAGKAQLAGLASQLVQIFAQISQAQAQGPAYTNSAAFQSQAAGWTSQLFQIQQQLSALLSTSVVQTTPTTIPTLGGTTSSCPTLTRDLQEGAQGSDVASLQLFLAKDSAARFAGTVNGYFDAQTTQAIQRYQTGYGIVSYGTPASTGFGKVGPATRASINVVCSRTYVTSVPPVIIPAGSTPTYGYVPPTTTTVGSGNSTAQISLIPSLTGQSGGPNSVTFSVNIQPNTACSASTFMLSFGDGAQQNITGTATCSNQIQQISHVYPQTGTYNATLTSGGFSTTLVVTISPPNNSISLTASAGTNSYGLNLVAVYKPGTQCTAGQYTINFGDNSQQSANFSGCSTQTQTFTHTYSQGGSYLITASDAQGRTVTTNFTAVVVQAAGSGDPFLVLSVEGDGANNSTTFTDVSPKAHALASGGSPRVDATNAISGSGSIALNGSSYVSTPSSTDFNLGTGPFTIDLWFYVDAFPAVNTQAAILMQASSNAADSTLGGAGLELFGNQLYFVGRVGGATYHPYYNNSTHSSTLSLYTWYHAALVRSGNTITLYLNGVKQGTVIVSGEANASTAALTLGRYGEFAGNYFSGHIDALHIAKGIARWTADFDPVAYYGLSDGSTVSGSALATGVRTADIAITHTPGAVCTGATYNVDFGDGSTSAVTFSPSCDPQTMHTSHVYPRAGTFTITVSNNLTGASFNVTVADTNAGYYTPYVPPHEGSGGNG